MCAEKIQDLYGVNVFNDATMKTCLPKTIYESLKKTIERGYDLDPLIAENVANAMKDWAVSKGATHYTHWFQPLNGITAEKHDAFISPTSDGKAIMEFSGKELIKGESDASSFPSGGLRATFEARGYTAWDCTSPAFIKDGSLYIPTIFCSYTGEALDKKTPLLLSMEALNVQVLRVLKHLGDNDTKRIVATVGAEQEYFLVDREMYERRLDLMLCGRTLFGKQPAKGQEMDDHYYGRLRLRVSAFMKELDEELWKLGVSAKTKHNEAAPAQHELAPIFTTANIACDHNQITMEIMKRTAKRHGLACLLHEKPFEGVNGSGKHINWSISTDKGKNLLDPGSTPNENMKFILILCAIIKAIDENAAILRNSMASASNDCRLGTHEAPPAIISMFIGDELAEILNAIEEKRNADQKSGINLNIGVSSLPAFARDSTDRNRTSPIAFTGNKFEFRMCGSIASIGRPCFVINTIIAEQFRLIADELDTVNTDDKDVKMVAIKNIMQNIIKEHKRIIFNGNNYTNEWVKEAFRRGLPNLPDTVTTIPAQVDERIIGMFLRHHVLTRSECLSRSEIMYQNYANTINIESQLMIEISSRQILPAAMKYVGKLAKSAKDLMKIKSDYSIFEYDISKITSHIQAARQTLEDLNNVHDSAANISCIKDRATYFRDEVLPLMRELRISCDKIEADMPNVDFPIPSYFDLMYRV